MITVCDNCQHRVIRIQLGESLCTLHFGAVKLCQKFMCECDKPE